MQPLNPSEFFWLSGLMFLSAPASLVKPAAMSSQAMISQVLCWSPVQSISTPIPLKPELNVVPDDPAGQLIQVQVPSCKTSAGREKTTPRSCLGTSPAPSATETNHGRHPSTRHQLACILLGVEMTSLRPLKSVVVGSAFRRVRPELC